MRSLIVTIFMAAVILTSCGDDASDVGRSGIVDVSGTWLGKVSFVQTTNGYEELELALNLNQSGTTITGSMGVKQDTSFSSIVTGTIDGNKITATTTTTNEDTECANWSVSLATTVISNIMKVNIWGVGCSDEGETETNYINASDGILTLQISSL